DRRLLIEQLAWQDAMGIDEILLDDATDDTAVTLGALAPAAVAAPSDLAPSDLARPDGASAAKGAPMQEEPSGSVPSSHAPAPSRRPATPPPELAGIDSLEALRTTLEAFEGCALKHTASNMIFADGNPAAKLMVIGEVPGRDEDRVGLPLVGVAGQLFDRMLASIRLSRADAYVTTLIPWRPPGNRTPTDEEMDILMPWLCRHIQLADPDRILLLGGAPAKSLLGQAGGILKLRGRWHDLDTGDGVARRAMATLHPAYLLRSPAQKRLAYADLLALAAELG
ncbi:MAG: uracil-DNA glycosylase, partial [Pseudomonadota bacterium]|nr:uracil-DNA glycosylase [Pseudomonadota bacterium]